MQAEIKNWLEGNRDYEYGLELYLKFPDKDSATEITLKMGESMFTMSMLEAEFEKRLVFEEPVAEKQIEWKNPYKMNRENLPAELQVKFDEMIGVYRKAKMLKPQLQYLDDQERFDMSGRLVSMNQKVIKIQAEINYYQEFGKLKGETEPDLNMHSEYVQMIKDYAANKNYVSRYRNKKGFEESVKERKARLDYIEKVIEAGGIIYIEHN